MLYVPWWSEISPLRNAFVEMTEGAGRLFYNLRPLKGKRLTTFCASLALLQNVFAVHRKGNPPPSAPQALSPPERKRTQPFYTTRGVSRAPFLKSAPEGRHHNPRPERPSNLRTLRPSGRSILRTFTPKVCPRAKPRQPSHRRCVPLSSSSLYVSFTI